MLVMKYVRKKYFFQLLMHPLYFCTRTLTFAFSPYHRVLAQLAIGNYCGRITLKTSNCCLFWCLIKFIDQRYSQKCWYFRPSFVNYCPSTFSLLHLRHPSPPFQSQLTVYSDSVWLKGWGVFVLETIFCRSLSLCSDQIQKLQNCYTTPNKVLGGEGGLRQINTYSKVPLQVNF